MTPAGTDLVRQQLLTALQTKVIPWLGDRNGLPTALVEPPLPATAQIRLLGYRPPLPEAPRLKPPSIYHCIWPKHEMDAARYIGMGCILEGEADFTFGTNIDRAIPSGEQSIGEGEGSRFLQAVSVMNRTLLVFPPGIPRPSGRRPHWERPDKERAYSRILWLLFLPTVVFCHLCYTEGETHGTDGVVTLEDSRIEPLAQLIVEELNGRLPHSEPIVQRLTQVLMLRLERALSSQLLLPGRQLPLHHIPLPNASVFVRSICQHIQTNLAEPLTLSEIARSHWLSPSQLNRRLQAEVGMSAIEYLIHCRVETARGLLENPEMRQLSLQEIGNLVGFADASYFRRVFTRQVGVAPREYRARLGGVDKTRE
jgi:AraC-like DNA-binding protein